MKIIIKPLDGKEAFTVDVKLSETFLDIKTTIQNQQSICILYQSLIYDGKEQEDHKQIKDTKLSDNQTLELIPKANMKNKIFVTSLSRTTAIDCNLTDTIAIIKKKLQEQLGQANDSQRLIFRLSQLQDCKTLKEYNLQYGFLLLSVFPMRGGSLDNFDFSSFQNSEVVTLAQTAPTWRYLNAGLNMQGLCLNAVCPAFNQQIIQVLGLGSFNIARLLLKVTCPQCHHITKADGGCYFFDCIYQIEGRKSGENKDYEHKGEAGKQNAIYYKGNNVEDKCKWQYLEIKTYQA